MVSKHLFDEVELVSTMKQYNLTVEQAKEAMKRHADDLQFQKDLDALYENGLDNEWDTWHDGDLK